MSEPLAFTSHSPAQTRRLGARLGHLLRPGDLVLLSGELGAGKTVFVQGIARGLGVSGPVSSKSFVLLGEYQADARRGRLSAGQAGLKLYHADLYRLEAPEEAEELALTEYCSDGPLLVEWPERAWHIFPSDHLLVRFQITGERTRTLTLEAKGQRSSELLQSLVGKEM